MIICDYLRVPLIVKKHLHTLEKSSVTVGKNNVKFLHFLNINVSAVNNNNMIFLINVGMVTHYYCYCDVCMLKWTIFFIYLYVNMVNSYKYNIIFSLYAYKYLHHDNLFHIFLFIFIMNNMKKNTSMYVI